MRSTTVCACDQKRFSAVLLDAGVQIADLGLGFDDGLAFDLEHDLQHAVRRRMLRPHREHHRVAFLADDLGRQRRATDIVTSRVRLRDALDLFLQRFERAARRRRAGLHVALERERGTRRTFARGTAQRIIFAQRMAFPVVRHLNAAQIRRGRRKRFRTGRRLRVRPSRPISTDRSRSAACGSSPRTPHSRRTRCGVPTSATLAGVDRHLQKMVDDVEARRRAADSRPRRDRAASHSPRP